MQRLDNTPYNQVPHIRRDNRFDSGKLNAYTIFFKLVLMLQPKDEATEVCLIYRLYENIYPFLFGTFTYIPYLCIKQTVSRHNTLSSLITLLLICILSA